LRKVILALSPLSAVYGFFISFAIIMSPAFAGFEMCLSLPMEEKGRTLMTQIKRIYANFDSKWIERMFYKNKQDAIFCPVNAG
jgi:hypothetical protein